MLMANFKPILMCKLIKSKWVLTYLYDAVLKEEISYRIIVPECELPIPQKRSLPKFLLIKQS